MSERRVWKFTITDLREEITFMLPDRAEVIHFAAQDGVPAIWVLIEPDRPLMTRRFRLAGTGHPLPANGLVFVGTCFQGPFVWHLFEDITQYASVQEAAS